MPRTSAVAALVVIASGLCQPAFAQVIATTDGEKPNTRLEVQQLKRESGGAVMLRFVVINDTSSSIMGGDFSASPSNFGSIDAVYLTDMINKKKFEVVRDTNRQCLVPHFIPLDDVPLAR
jgi:hypothetical protein